MAAITFPFGLSVEAGMWILFAVIILTSLSLDLGVFNRRPHAVGLREAAIWSAVWISLALAFNVAIYFTEGPDKAQRFLGAFFLEKALSVDNLFVFIVIFGYFAVDRTVQHRLLFWGILGALLMRAAMIFLGVELLDRFQWILYVFGGFLVLTGIKVAVAKGGQVHPEKNIVVRLLRRVLPVAPAFEGARFFTRLDGRLVATPLLLALVAVETTDLVFAIDSVPAVIGFARDPFIIYTSNIFAILGLRALFFVLASIMVLFRFLKYGVGIILVFIGVKMILEAVLAPPQSPDVSHATAHVIPISVSLGVLGGILALSIILSVLIPARKPPPPAAAASESAAHARAPEATPSDPPPAAS